MIRRAARLGVCRGGMNHGVGALVVREGGMIRRAAGLGALVVVASLLIAAPATAATVYAAASLRGVFPRIDPSQTFSFGASGQLQRQIVAGAPADVFAAASTSEPRELRRAGRCGAPSIFATNKLILIVPRANRASIRTVEDLARGPRRRLAVGAPGVPVGDYTRTLLRNLGLGRVLTRNAVSNEANVAGVVAKVALGSADAGFAYLTDGRLAGRRVRQIPLPARAQPAIAYAFCIVRRRGADVAGAQRFVNRVRSPRGRAALRAAGFGVPGP
jgi:molybdate transport system substrate-binding protein